MSVSVTVAILGGLTAILNLARQILGLRSRPSARQLAEKAAHDARAASASGDVTAVNGQVERDRVRRSLGVMALCALLSGCGSPRPVCSAHGSAGASVWRVGLSWGAAPAVERDSPDGVASGSPSSASSSCSSCKPE